MRAYLIIFIPIILLFLYFFPAITGFVTGNVNVSIREKTDGAITSLSYPSSLWFGQFVNITAEFTNIGSTEITEQMIIKIYKYNGRLNLTATYYDSSALLLPGMKKFFNALYVPITDGTYYIQVRAPYDSRVAELWGSFIVYPPNWTAPVYECSLQCGYYGFTYGACRQICVEGETQIIGICTNPAYPACCCGGYINVTTTGTPTTIPGNVTITTTVNPYSTTVSTTSSIATTTMVWTSLSTTTTVAIPQLSVDYDEEIRVYRGGSILYDIIVNNTGNIKLDKIRLHLSTTSYVNTTINPKFVSTLAVNETILFIVSIDAFDNTPVGDYPLSFEVISDEAKIEKTATLKVMAEPPSIKDQVYDTILNYRILISEIGREILIADLKGFDTRTANESLTSAKTALENAEELYGSGEYESARVVLYNTKRHIEDSVFQLAHATLMVRAEPGPLLYIMLLLPIILTAIFVSYYLAREKRRRRPRLLRGNA